MRSIMVRLISRILDGLLVLIIRSLPALFRLLQIMLALAVTSITSLFVGVPTAVDRMSDSWIEQAGNRGVHLGHESRLRQGTTVVAGVTLVLGWIVVIGFVILLLSVL